MFKKILIANRGEIAVRVMKTAKKMGIKTVAVYSEADQDALFVEMADEAVAIGPAAAAESYLVIDKIVQACRDTGAEAVHPGYGFLSERAGFVEALDAAGIAFIGPRPHAISQMGDKITSKKIAKEAGVSTVPGHMDIIEDADEAVKISKDIGYPVMLKASAGGGGKGMRIARSDEEVVEGFTSARNEARSSFGDDRVFIEKFIEEPRHIEIQVLADSHGNTLYLGERECSIQRRHQKVVEEAPSPFLDEATRKAMGEQSVALSKAVQYQSAGTVEFIVDKDRNFYFLEMNTRLQVEHPVTEEVVGIDLVEQMIRVAAGETLTMTQDDVQLKGWAIETRVYAEDPLRNFMPSIGRLERYSQPADDDHTRVDTGVVEGTEISMFYDPMIAKLVTMGDTRAEAIKYHRQALDSYYIRGIQHNINFLSTIMAHPRFQEGRLSTNFIAEEFPDGFSGNAMTDQVKTGFIAAAVFMNAVEKSRESQIAGKVSYVTGPQELVWVIHIAGEKHMAAVMAGEQASTVIIGKSKHEVVTRYVPGDRVFVGLVDNVPLIAEVDKTPLGYVLTSDGVTADVKVLSEEQDRLIGYMPEKAEKDTSNMLLCPMPGLLVSLSVDEGDTVEPGQALAVVEAMKMENILRAEKSTKVAKILAGPGDSLAVDQVIIEFEEA